MMIVSLADMKTSLGIASGDTSQDAFLTEQINIVSEAVENYCRRIFNQATYTETFYVSDNAWSSNFKTFMYPVISVTTLTEDGVLLAGVDYRIHKPSGTITRLDGSFFTGDDSTVLTYVAGYASIPAPVVAVVKSLVTERYNKKNSGVDLSFGSDVQRVSIPGAISIDFDYSLSNNDRKTPFGVILGSQVNVLDFYRSNRAVLPSNQLTYLA